MITREKKKIVKNHTTLSRWQYESSVGDNDVNDSVGCDDEARVMTGFVY